MNTSEAGYLKQGKEWHQLFAMLRNNIPSFSLLNDKYQELLSVCDALGMPLDHTNHIHQSM